MFALIAGVITAYVTAWLATPALERAAWRFGLLDRPGAGHHVHKRPVPRLGGVAVFFGFMMGALVAAALSDAAPHAARAFLERDPRSMALVAAGTILFIIGLLDDLKDIAPPVKLAGQAAAAAIVCYFGFRIDALTFPGGATWHLGWLALPVTVVWIVGVSNAINLVDGIDGLAGGVSVIGLVAVAVSSMLLGNPTAHWYALILAAALVAFVRFNYPPASIFLGDSGSLVVGFLLAVLSVKAATRADGVTYPLVPIFALAYPLLDTGFAILRRWLRRVPFSRADDRHIHHQLCALDLSPRRAVGMIFLGSAGVAALGLCTVFAPPGVTVAVALAGAVVLTLVLAILPRVLEYHEFLEVGQTFQSVLRDSRRMIGDAIHARDLTRVIAAARTLDEVSAILSDAAADLHFAHVSLRPAKSAALDEMVRAFASDLWRIEYPIPMPVTEGWHGIAQDTMMLTIWCRTDGTDRPAGAERIARILAPAIGAWLRSVPALSIEAAVELPPRRHIKGIRIPVHSPVVPVAAIRAKREYSIF